MCTGTPPTASSVRDRVVGLISRVSKSQLENCTIPLPSAVPASYGHVVVVTASTGAPAGQVSVRLEIGEDVRRLRAFCAGCLSRSCGHALRVLAVFRAAADDDRVAMTRFLDAEAPDAISDDELARRWQEREAARAETQAAARRQTAAAEREAEARARAQAHARGTDLPLFAA